MSEEERASRLNRLYAVASGINEAMVRIPGENDLFREACRIAVERGGLRMAWVGRNDPALGQLVPVARWGHDEGYVDAIHISTDARFREGQGPGGTAFRSGTPAICNDIAADTQFFAYRKEALAHGYRSCAAFPLKTGGRPVAVFLVYSGATMYFDADEMALLSSIADNFSFALEARESDAQRRQMVTALRASESRLRAVIDNEPECVKSATLAGALVDINRAGLVMMQADSPDQLIGRQLTDFAHPEDRAAFQAFHNRVARGEPGELKVRAIGLRGRMLWIDMHAVPLREDDGAISSVLYVSRDVTERTRAEEENRALAERLETTLSSITDALIAVDAQWRFTYVNRAAESVLRRSRAELMGTNMWEQFPEGKGTPFEAAYLRALETGEAQELQSFYPPLDTWLEIRAYPAREGGLTIYFRDVGEQHAAQAEILRLNAELEQRVRQRTMQLEAANEELRAFSYSVAHDLRAPLASIGGFNSALKRELAAVTGTRALHYMDRVQESVARTSEMIDALLALASLSRAELRWEAVDLSAMADAALQHCRQGSPQRVAEVHIQPGLAARGDPRLLQLVLDNLMSNAWKFSAGRAAARITFAALAGPEGETVFELRDNGVGFDPAYSQNLFGAFQRLHPQGEFPGWGIGLANVRRILTRHSGRIWAHSRPGEGAAFYFTLGDQPA